MSDCTSPDAACMCQSQGTFGVWSDGLQAMGSGLKCDAPQQPPAPLFKSQNQVEGTRKPDTSHVLIPPLFLDGI